MAAVAGADDHLFQLATEIGGIGVWEWNLDAGSMYYSPRAREICGFTPDEPIALDDVRSVTHPEDLPLTWAQAERALDPAVRSREQYDYRVIRRSDGAVRWVLALGAAEFSGDGPKARAVRYLGTVMDVTDRKLAEQAVNESEGRLRLALEAGKLAVFHIDADGGVAQSPALNALFGFPPDAKPTREDYDDAYMPAERDRLRALFLASYERRERFFDAEAQIRRRDGAVRWLNIRAEVVSDATGAPVRVIGVASDVTERKEAQERLMLLAREVDHRANNLLSVVQGAVALSRAKSADDLRTVIEGRVQALARAHKLLTRSRWEGAALETLVREELAPFTIGRRRQGTIRGPAVLVRPAAAQGLGMVLHELTTNAAKYGALSTADGRVDVRWECDGDVLTLTWLESGGPAVSRPERSGFGSSVIARALGGGLGGETEIAWRPEGVQCVLQVPMSQMVQPRAGPDEG